jgi:hypothetical protein
VGGGTCGPALSVRTRCATPRACEIALHVRARGRRDCRRRRSARPRHCGRVGWADGSACIPPLRTARKGRRCPNEWNRTDRRLR